MTITADITHGTEQLGIIVDGAEAVLVVDNTTVHDFNASQLWRLAEYARAAAVQIDAVILREAGREARNGVESGAICRALLRLLGE